PSTAAERRRASIVEYSCGPRQEQNQTNAATSLSPHDKGLARSAESRNLHGLVGGAMESVSVNRRAGVEEQHTGEGVELQFEELLDGLPVAAYTCERTGLITYYNGRAVELWGRTPQLNDDRDRWCGSFRLFNAKDGAPLTHDLCWMALTVLHGTSY